MNACEFTIERLKKFQYKSQSFPNNSPVNNHRTMLWQIFRAHLIDSFSHLKTTHVWSVVFRCPLSSPYASQCRQFASGNHIWHNANRPVWCSPTREIWQIFRRWQEPCCWDAFTDFSSIVIGSFWQPALELYIPQLSGGRSLMRSSGNLWIKKKIPKEEWKTGGEWKLCERLRLMRRETGDGEVIEKFDISHSKEKDGETSGAL